MVFKLIPGLLFGVLSVVAAANAQLTVQVHCEKDTFLVYEPIPVVVSIRNYSGRTIQLEGSEQKPWLSFVVTDDADSLVRTLGATPAGTAVLIPPGQAVSHAIDLLPLYELRSRGNYRVQAVVANAGASVVSSPLRFSLINGRELWSQVVGLPVSDGAAEEYRNFALVARRGPTEDSLFVSVKDEPREVMYSLVPLGGFLQTAEPQARVDSQARLHVLYQNGPRSFGYAVIDSSAKLIRRAAYADFLSRPELVSDQGTVNVRGGEQTYPKPERIVSDEELNPPAPANPKPNRHWWWPFAPHTSSNTR